MPWGMMRSQKDSNRYKDLENRRIEEFKMFVQKPKAQHHSKSLITLLAKTTHGVLQ